MTIQSITTLPVADVQLVTIKRFHDERGYFTEVFQHDVLTQHDEIPALRGKQFVQQNESYSVPNVFRGLHTQSAPNIDKLLRVLKGTIIDIAVDIRPHSPTFGKAVSKELRFDKALDTEELLLVPFGFAHGFLVLEEAHVQYLQTGTWNKEGEAIIRVTDPSIDWSLTNSELTSRVQSGIATAQITPKDKAGMTLNEWKVHPLASTYE